jgi:dienelactone hydrolase
VALLAALLCSMPAARAAAQNAARNAAYKAALPLYHYDPKSPLSVQVTPGKHYTDSQELRIVYSSANGERVPAVVFEPNRASMWHPAPAIVLLHGLGGSKESLVPFGHFLAATGYAVLILDEYGQGERRKPDPAGDDPQAAETDAVHGVQQTIVDVRRGIDYLRTRIHISSKRICIMGFSLGAIIAADVAGIDPRVQSVVLVSGGGDLGLILRNLARNDPYFRRSSIGNLTPEQLQLLGPMLAAEDPLTFAGHVAPRPVLMLNGKLDRIIPPKAAQALYEALRQSPNNHVTMQWFPDQNHFVGLDVLYPTLRTWLEKNLGMGVGQSMSTSM